MALEQRIYLGQFYGLGEVLHKYAIQLLNAIYPNVSGNRTALNKSIEKFDETESVSDKKKTCNDDTVTIMARVSNILEVFYASGQLNSTFCLRGGLWNNAYFISI